MRRRRACGPASAIPPTRRMWPDRARARSRPTRRTPPPSPVRRRGGTDARARVERRPDRGPVAAPSRSSAVARHPIASPLGRSARHSAAHWGACRARVPASPYVIRRPSRNASSRSASCSASRRVEGSSGSRPRVNTARSRSATTYALNRGPHNCTSDGSSQLPGSVPSTRAWIERSAARGMLSCSPAHAAALSEFGPGGSRSSRPPERRRNARTCARVSSSRRFATSPLASWSRCLSGSGV